MWDGLRTGDKIFSSNTYIYICIYNRIMLFLITFLDEHKISGLNFIVIAIYGLYISYKC